MEAMFLLIAISLVFVVAIGVAFWWAIFAGQFDDSDSAAKSILADEEQPGQRAEPSGEAGPNAGQKAGAGDLARGRAEQEVADGNAGGKAQ